MVKPAIRAFAPNPLALLKWAVMTPDATLTEATYLPEIESGKVRPALELVGGALPVL